ncbi:MAG: hypothetical protein V2A79_02720 [Planctomycetota bacterium]
MIIETSRFGRLEVDAQRPITFPERILGFPNQQKYALVQTEENSGFYSTRRPLMRLPSWQPMGQTG